MFDCSPKPSTREGGAAGWSVETRGVMVRSQQVSGGVSRRAPAAEHYLLFILRPHNPRPGDTQEDTGGKSRVDTESGFIVMRIITVQRKYHCDSFLQTLSLSPEFCSDDEKMFKIK